VVKMLINVLFKLSADYCLTAVNGCHADGQNLIGRNAVSRK